MDTIYEVFQHHADTINHLQDPAWTLLGLWVSPFCIWPHPVDSTRLAIVGVLDEDSTDTVVSVDDVARVECEHPICVGVFERRRRERAALAADAALFTEIDVTTDVFDGPVPYMIRIEELLAAEAAGWDRSLAGHSELSWAFD